MSFVIAEVGQAHDGSLGMLHSYIDAISKTGVNAVKFQTHLAEAESSSQEPFRVKLATQDKTRFDYWKRVSFEKDAWRQIKAHCEDVGLVFMSSPFSLAAVDLLEEIGTQIYKIGSGEVSNLLMLDKLADIGKEVILSSGMSDFSELDKAVSALSRGRCKISVMQCTTEYPTPFNHVGLNVISELKEKYNCPVGLSDHSGSIFPCLAAAMSGAELFEVHAVFDKRMFGPDTSSSLTIEELKLLVDGIHAMEVMRANPVNKADLDRFTGVKQIFEKALAVNKELPAGHVLTKGDLEAKKPASCGIAAKDYCFVIGRRLLRPLNKWDFITLDAIADEA